MCNFEKLEVWQKGIDLTGVVYDATRLFPAEERFGLMAQMRRAAASIPSNIAEGASRSSRVDNARFVEIATGLAFELVPQACIANRQGFLDDGVYRLLYSKCGELSRMLSGLRSHLLGKHPTA